MMKGYLTVFLSLSLSVLAGFVLLLTGSAIRNGEKLRLEGDVDIAMNSALAEFSIPLHERYGLLYVDLTYLGKEPSCANLESRLRFYLGANRERDGNGKPWGVARIGKVSVRGIGTAAQGNGSSMKRQALCYIRDRGIERQEACIEGYPARAEGLEQTDAMEEWRQLQEQIAGMELPVIQNEEGEWEEVLLGNPADRIFGFSGSDVLYLLGINMGKVGGGRIRTDYISAGKRSDHAGKPQNTLEEEAFRSYLFEKMGNYRKKKEDGLLKYQLEYIVCGHGSDEENLRAVIGRLFLWRFAANVNQIFGNGGLFGEAQAAAFSLHAVSLKPEFGEPVTRSILYACAFLETIADVKCLLDGGRVEMDKSGWNTGIQQVLEGGLPGAGVSDGEGLTYEQYLACMLALLSEDTRNLRTMDVMEMDIRYLTGNPLFSMDWCVERFTADIMAQGGWNYEYALTRTYGYY